MARKMKVSRDNQLKHAATMRAKIIPYLNDGSEYSAADIAKTFSDTVAEVNYSEAQVGALLSNMAKNKLISSTKKGFRNYYSIPAKFAGAITEKAVKPAKTAVGKRSYKVHGNDVELVLNGTTIIVGRNTATGRLRIIIEE